ncbi:hypothetical protein X739_19490 [Mesorhizobium sp. LNHC220B00]|nr:hypothetical protein X739_19490 [Mesorhizobium sp. LNHC220B00]
MTMKFQGCMKPTDGAWWAASSSRASTSSSIASDVKWLRTSRRVNMAR